MKMNKLNFDSNFDSEFELAMGLRYSAMGPLDSKYNAKYLQLIESHKDISKKELTALENIFYPKWSRWKVKRLPTKSTKRLSSAWANHEIQIYLALAKITTTKVRNILNLNIFHTLYPLNTEEYNGNPNKNVYEQTIELKDTTGNGLDDIVINNPKIPANPLILQNIGHKMYMAHNPLYPVRNPGRHLRVEFKGKAY